MATLNLGRVRLNFKGNFVDLDGQNLVFFDAVTYAGSLYAVKVQNVVVNDTDSGNRPPTTTGQSSFIKITEGVTFTGLWSADSSAESDRIYYQNEIVRYGATSYIALQEVPKGRSNPNTEVINNTGYWSELVKGFGNYVPNFNGTQELSIGDIFRWQGSVYLTTDEVVLAGKTPSTDPDSFDRLDNGLAPQGKFEAGRQYNFLDTVNFHGKTYAVIEPYGTTNQPIEISNGEINPDWELLTEGFEYAGELLPGLVEGYYPNDVVTFEGGVYIVIEKTYQYQTPITSPEKFDVLIPNDSVRGTDFNVDGFIVRENGSLVVDTTTYLAENQNIILTGDVTGSGKTNIDLTIAVESITDKPIASAALTRQGSTKVLAAVDPGDGNLVLRQINPNDVLTGVVITFNDTNGIERLVDEIGTDATLSLNQKAISTLPTIGTQLDGLPDLVSGDEFLIRDDSDNTLKSLSYQQLLEKINAQITGPIGAGDSTVSGVITFPALLDTPTTYIGQANSFVKVNQAENALEFVEDDIFLQILVYG